MALYDLEAKIGADTTGFDRGLKRMQGGLSSVKSGIGSFIKSGLGLAGITAGLTGLVAGLKTMETKFLGLESSVGRVNDIFGSSSGVIRKFAAGAKASLGMAETDAQKFAATYGNLFKSMTTGSEENSRVTIAMLSGSAVVASKTGRTMEDVMERIRSGLLGSTEAIEDLGINVGVAAISTTDAFKQIANGRTWEQLGFYEQKQILTLGILEQIHKNYGDTVANNSGAALARLSSGFQDLTAFAGMFVNAGLMPVVNWLIGVVSWATAAVKALGNLFGLSIGSAEGVTEATTTQTTAQNNQTKAVGATAKATQKLAGFDQINTLSSSKGGGGGGAGSGAAGAGGKSPFDGIQLPNLTAPGIDTSGFEASLKKLVGLFKFDNFIKSWDNLKAAVAPLGDHIGDGLVWLWDNVLVPYSQWVVNEVAPRYIDLIAGAVGLVDSVITSAAPGFQILWDKFLKPVAEWTGGLILEVLDVLKKVFSDLSNVFKAKSEKITGILSGLADIFNVIWKKAKPALTMVWNIVKSVFSKIGTAVGIVIDLISGLVDFVAGVLTGDWERAWKGLQKYVDAVWSGIKLGFSTLYDALKIYIDYVVDYFKDAWDSIKKAWGGVADWFGDRWDDIKDAFSAVGSWFSTTFTNGWTSAKGGFTAVKTWASDRWGEVKSGFDSVGSWFSTTFSGAWTSAKGGFTQVKTWATDRWGEVKSGFDAVGSWFSTTFSGAWSSAKGGFTAVKTWASDRWGEVKSGFDSVGSWFSTTFSGAWSSAKGGFTSVKTWATDRWGEVKSGFNSVSSWFSTTFGGGWTSIKNAFNSTDIGKFFSGIWETIKSKFTTVGTSIGNAIGGAFKTAVNSVFATVERVVNGFIDKINGVIDFLRNIPGLKGLSHVSKIYLPRLAKGGIIDRPTVAMIGEAGREAVMPLENNTGWMSEMARQLAAAMNGPQMAGAGGDIVIPIYLDGNLLDQVIISAQERKNMRTNGR